jgi:hypothetical protein
VYPPASYVVLPSRPRERDKAHHDFIVCVNAKVKSGERLKRFALVCYAAKRDNNESEILHTHCRLVIDDSLNDDQVRLDHSVRTALDIPFQQYQSASADAAVFSEIKVGIAKLDVPLHLLVRNWLARSCGARYLYMRVFKADVADIERGLVRVPPEAFGPLAISSTGRIVIESVKRADLSEVWKLVRRSIAAYELTDDMIRRRKIQAEHDPIRYRERAGLNVGDSDIWGIYMDQYARDELGVASRSPVKVRHSSRNLIMRESREVGIIFVATMLIAGGAVVAISPLHKLGWLELACAIIGSLMATTFITIAGIRGRAGR